MKISEEVLQEFEDEMSQALKRYHKGQLAINQQRGRRFKQQKNV